MFEHEFNLYTFKTVIRNSEYVLTDKTLYISGSHVLVVLSFNSVIRFTSIIGITFL